MEVYVYSKVIIYHHDDQDGYLSAAVAYSRLSLDMDNVIKFVVGHYDHTYDFNALDWADTVYVLDYSFSDEVMEIYREKIIWIDHHKTAIESVRALEEKIGHKFKGIQAIGKSGCLLTWYYFYGDKPIPEVVKYVNDRDVWDWKYGDDTAAFHEASMLFLSDIGYWCQLLSDRELALEELERGYSLLKYIRTMVDKYIASYSWEGTFEGHPVVFLCGPTRIFGELHKRLREAHPAAKFAVVIMPEGEEIRVSFYRNDACKDIDVSAIAKRYGGGGHEGAAGFVLKSSIVEFIQGAMHAN